MIGRHAGRSDAVQSDRYHGRPHRAGAIATGGADRKVLGQQLRKQRMMLSVQR